MDAVRLWGVIIFFIINSLGKFVSVSGLEQSDVLITLVQGLDGWTSILRSKVNCAPPLPPKAADDERQYGPLSPNLATDGRQYGLPPSRPQPLNPAAHRGKYGLPPGHPLLRNPAAHRGPYGPPPGDSLSPLAIHRGHPLAQEPAAHPPSPNSTSDAGQFHDADSAAGNWTSWLPLLLALLLGCLVRCCRCCWLNVSNHCNFVG